MPKALTLDNKTTQKIYSNQKPKIPTAHFKLI